MIVTFDDLTRYRGKVAMVDGAFDPLHHGHVRYFRSARTWLDAHGHAGTPLLCNIASDAYLRSKHEPFLAGAERAEVIDALGDIAYTHLSPADTETVLGQLRPTHYVKGREWEQKGLPPRQVTICGELGIGIVFCEDHVASSTERLLKAGNAFRGLAAPSPTLTAFETRVLEQRVTTPDHYDDEYFVSEWRAEGNDYTIETRRTIEGRHPEVIKEVFAPAKVLDMGCGPGVLLLLLEEQGVVADGMDFSPASRELAAPSVRDRILIGDVTDRRLPDASYDLVICREVFEHLTVRQVREAVTNLCRLSSRYVYVTTRFHPDPASLVDFTTQFDVDPTHITLLNKDLLRLFFVLEGHRCRADLEARIDWMGKGRVLVYEKAVSDP